MKTLYKTDSKGKIRIWKIWTEGAKIIQEAGLEDGKLVRNEKEAKGKNIGKKNETQPAEQAIAEMMSTYEGKLTEGYFKTKIEAKTEVVILPMLAKSYGDEKAKIDWKTAYVQPKLDGMRCLAICKGGEVTLKSRDGKLITTLPHIMKTLSAIAKTCDIVLDGELYADGYNFQENMRLIKKYRLNQTELIKYHLYDVVSDFPFRLRSEMLLPYAALNHMELVPTIMLLSEKDLTDFHKIHIQQGYEGSMIRWGTEGYKVNGRSSNLLKYKDFKDMDLVIMDIVPSEQRPEWGQPIYELKGKKFSSGLRFSHEERKDFLTNKAKYIGKKANVRYFELTEDGIPRFPVTVGVHEDR